MYTFKFLLTTKFVINQSSCSYSNALIHRNMHTRIHNSFVQIIINYAELKIKIPHC